MMILSWRAVCREEKKTDDPNQVQALDCAKSMKDELNNL
jgi:hypothetical protein